VDIAKSDTPFTHYKEDWDAETAIQNSNATVVIELTHTNIESGEPALSHSRAALESGKHLICGNKGPAAVAYNKIHALANNHGKLFLNEATVMSGTPVFSLIGNTLAGNKVLRIRGILNGATNFILSEMEKDVGLAEAIALAETHGYLEADHTADIEGYDALAKVLILSNALLGADISAQDVERVGIGQINEGEVRAARSEGKRWKLVASMAWDGRTFKASVKPEKLDVSDPLAQVMGTTNSITITTDILGDVTISGPGAGRLATGYAILSDLLTINAGGTS